jgi:hypothetical protein
LFSRFLCPYHFTRAEMNKTLEAIRGSWIARDREAAEANRNILRHAIDRIPADLCEKFVGVLEWAENTEGWNDAIIDVAARNSEGHINENRFLEEQIKCLIQAIRVTKDVDSIKALRAVTRETIERLEERKYQEERKRLIEQGYVFEPPDDRPSLLLT